MRPRLVRFPNKWCPAAEIAVEKRKALHKLIAERNRRVMINDLYLDWETHPVFREYDDHYDYSDPPIPWVHKEDLHTRELADRYAKIGKVRPSLKLLKPAPSPSCRLSRNLALSFSDRSKGTVPFWRWATQKEARKRGYNTTGEREDKYDFCRQLGRMYRVVENYEEEQRKKWRDKRLEDACLIPPPKAVVRQKKGKGIMGWFREERQVPVWDETKEVGLGEGVRWRAGGSLPYRSGVGRGSQLPSHWHRSVNGLSSY